MKTSTWIFSIAAGITLVGIMVALVDLMKHKTHSTGQMAPVFVTLIPSSATDTTTATTTATTLATTAPTS